MAALCLASSKGCLQGWANPVFSRLNAQLAMAMMGINAAKGVEFGLGFDFVNRHGSEVVDSFVKVGDAIRTRIQLFWWYSGRYKQW